jgi:hypothetical protein
MLLFQDPTLPVPHVLEPNIFKFTLVIRSRFFQSVFYSPDFSAQEPAYETSSLLYFVMCGDPVFGSEDALREDAILGTEIELLSRGYGDVVEAVEESEGVEGWIGFGDWTEGFMRDAVWRVDYAFCFFAVDAG